MSCDELNAWQRCSFKSLSCRKLQLVPEVCLTTLSSCIIILEHFNPFYWRYAVLRCIRGPLLLCLALIISCLSHPSSAAEQLGRQHIRTDWHRSDSSGLWVKSGGEPMGWNCSIQAHSCGLFPRPTQLTSLYLFFPAIVWVPFYFLFIFLILHFDLVKINQNINAL